MSSKTSRCRTHRTIPARPVLGSLVPRVLLLTVAISGSALAESGAPGATGTNDSPAIAPATSSAAPAPQAAEAPAAAQHPASEAPPDARLAAASAAPAPAPQPPPASPGRTPKGGTLGDSAATDSPLPPRTMLQSDLPVPDALAPLTWNEQSGQGVSLGYESGLWGSWWEQGLRVGVPFSRHFAATLRVLYVSDTTIDEDVPYTADLGGRLDLIGRSIPIFNAFRIYGGGGFQVLQPVFATEGRDTQLGGGGHFGVEFFHNPNFSFFFEVGGQGGKPSPGATILAGMAFYPWTH